MKKQTDLRIQRLPLKRIFFFLLLLYIGALIIPYVPHKKVSDSYKENFAGRSFYNNGKGTERTAYIDDNMEALKYRLRMIEEAEEEIILLLKTSTGNFLYMKQNFPEKLPFISFSIISVMSGIILRARISPAAAPGRRLKKKVQH